VATRVGGLPTVVTDGVTGLLVDGHDPRDWARVVTSLLEDPLRRRRMGIAAAAAARRFGWDATVDALLEVYAGALADRPRRATSARRRGPVPVGELAVAP
jgi:D-inositol-3-phosphate glycosyltransferase